MSIRRLRQIVTAVTIALAASAATLLYVHSKQQKSLQGIASQITTLCELPEIPPDLTIQRATIDRSDDPLFVDVSLALTGPKDTLYPWLDQFDRWEKKRPGEIQNHTTRESESTPRFHFSAEVYLK